MTAARNLPPGLEELAAELEALGFVRRRPRTKKSADVVVSDVDRQRVRAAARRMGLHVKDQKR